jgi:hypothetical protein
MGRPQKEIDQTQFEKLCGLQCTQEEIAGWFDCSPDTIENWCKRTYKESFSEVFGKKREAGKISLRRSQWRLAEKSAAMAIFLGKNYLGQSDHVVIEDRSALDKLDEILKGTQENAIELQRKAE